MDIKHGDIIILENGDRVKVSLEVLPKLVTKLVSGKRYRLKYNGRFCHLRDTNGENLGENIDSYIFTYVGEVPSLGGFRYIFFVENITAYGMWGADNLDFVVEEVE